MPHGKGTYGSQVGRPARKKKTMKTMKTESDQTPLELTDRILKTLDEKRKSTFPDLNKDGKVSYADVLHGKLKGKKKKG
tara:strand:- start:838 stop:1074 length:237 start_codon:yes stop_codon:yes gene_type:complete